MANVIKHKRGSGSDPSASDLILGELAIRTDTGKLFTKMDSGAIAEIAGGGSDIAINTLSSSSGTGGGSATFNGSAYRFTLSAPPNVSAAQLLVSINGVIQKPVAGTGQPSEGFSVDGTDIILGDAPATGSDFFILTFKSLGVSEPADNSVTSAKIVDGAIVNADINASAAIAGTKISPDFGSQNITTSGTITTTGNALTIQGTHPDLIFTDTNNNDDFKIHLEGGVFRIRSDTDSADRFAINSTGNVGINTTSPQNLLHIHKTSSGACKIRCTNTVTGSTNADGFEFGLNSSEQAFFHIREAAPILFSINSSERMRIDSSGVVSIGTTSPNGSASKLQVEDSGENNVYFVGNTSTLGARLILQNKNSTANAFSKVEGADASGQGVCSIKFNSVSDATNEGFLSFETRPANGLPTERMRIDSSGNVGIGTSSPAGLLHVKGSDIVQIVDSSNTAAEICFRNNTSTGNNIRIGGSGNNLTFDTGGSESMRINSSGHLFHGCTSSPDSSDPGTAIIADANQGQILIATNSTAQAVLMQFRNPNGGVGDIRTSGSGIIINGTSDYRVKENAVAISDGITRLKTLKPYRFNFKADPTKTLDGFFAHEVTSAVPEAVTGTKDEIATEDNDLRGFKKGDPILQGIDQSKLVPLLVAALQEAIGRIEVLEAK